MIYSNYIILEEAASNLGQSMDASQPVWERFLQGCSVLLFGMAVVFAVLCILWGILELFKIIFYHPNKIKKEPDPVIANNNENEEKENDEELVAAITAAISAYLSQESDKNEVPKFRVVSFKKHKI